MSKRAMAAVVLAVLMVSACSENPLSDLGHVTRDWVGEPTRDTGVMTPSTIPKPVYRSSSDVNWVNDVLSAEPQSPEEALATVWDRRESGDKYVQASRVEIMSALPGIEFPARLPDRVRFVSSQLLFDGDGSLANDFIAAFGLWTAEPYTVSRSVGQYGILWVTYPDAERSGCDRFSDRDINSCETVLYREATKWRLDSGGDSTLAWVAGAYQYELFYRSQISPEMALEISADLVPLVGLAVSPDPTAAGTSVVHVATPAPER